MMNVTKENGMPLSIAIKKAASDSSDKTLSAFYEWVDQKFRSSEYSTLRSSYAGLIDPKFLAICERTRNLMPIARLASWHLKRDLRTLDLGCGPGHMGLIANFFGHSSLGIDRAILFGALREFWGQDVVMHSIDADDPLPPVGKFHTITSILTNYGRAWTIGEWDNFIERIKANHLEPGGEFILNFPGNQDLEYRKYLRRKASRIEAGGRIMFFRAKDAGI